VNKKLTKQLTITAAMASAILVLDACRANDQPQLSSDAVCVDKVSKKRVADNHCAVAQNQQQNSGASNAFLWYYLGRSSAVPPMGYSVASPTYRGSYRPDPSINYRSAPPAPPSNYRSGLMSSTSLRSGSNAGFSPTTIRTSTAVSRGGFGASAHSFSAGS
jgi:uncharacterized protein YgiB involved in biofilm formation